MMISDEEQIESPPCSGKSTLLEHIKDHIHKAYPNDILHLTTEWPGMKTVSETKPRQAPYCPKQVYNDYVDGSDAIAMWRNLIESIQNSDASCTGMWILIDEAQLTYVDHVLWSALYGVVKSETSVRVIAAGSYGSHP